MKKLLLFLLAATALVAVIPSASAYEDDPWHTPAKMLAALQDRMHAIDVKRDHYGAGPRLNDRIEKLHSEMYDLTKRVEVHGGKPKSAKQLADLIGTQMSDIENEYNSRFHHSGVVIHVEHPW